jgi:FdhD protein
VAARIERLRPHGGGHDEDTLAVEEPLAIRIATGTQRQHLAVTMRTPGDDAELAVGWLFAEGVVTDRAEIADISWCARDLGRQDHNAVTVTLRGDALPDLSSFDRLGPVTSACGVCGKRSVDAVMAAATGRAAGHTRVDPAVLFDLPERLREAQRSFASTGGLHAAAVFDREGELLGLREDVGRHNALDKLIGAALLDGDLPWDDRILLLSGRASFELLQKAAMTGVGVVCAIGAPSSLAVDVADRAGITLVGFLRASGANVYSGADRLRAPSPLAASAR